VSCVALPAAHRLLEPGEALVVVGDQLAKRRPRGGFVECSRSGHGLDVGPVSGAVDHRLEHRELDRPEDRDPSAREGHDPVVPRGLRVDGHVVEEEVHRRLIPPQASLAFTCDDLRDLGRLDDAAGQRAQAPGGRCGGNEDIEVDVARAAGVERPVGERQGAAEGVRNPSPGESAGFAMSSVGSFDLVS